MIERTLTYPSTLRELYRQGKLYSRWRTNHSKSTLFLEIDNDPSNKQYPRSSRPPLPKACYGFGELFAGMHYLDLGFVVVRYYYYRVPGYDSYEQVAAILGASAAEFICSRHPQPPDLFVFDKKGCFFFVEVKLPTDSHKEKQEAFCGRIEEYLNKNMSQSRRAPHMPKGNWIELLKRQTRIVIRCGI